MNLTRNQTNKQTHLLFEKQDLQILQNIIYEISNEPIKNHSLGLVCLIFCQIHCHLFDSTTFLKFEVSINSLFVRNRLKVAYYGRNLCI